MSRMTRDEAVAKLAAGVNADVGACGALRELLEQQFDAAVRHQSARLADLAQQLLPALEAMEQRRVQRVSLVRALMGPDGDMAQLIAGLAPAVRAPLAAQWEGLEGMVVECKRLNTRNSTLLTDQFSVMQRVLHGEDETYAPR